MSESSGPVCGAETVVRISHLYCPPGHRGLPDGEGHPNDAQDQGERLHCVLQTGHEGDHCGPSARGIPENYPADVWASWPGDRPPGRMFTAWDCPIAGPDHLDDQACMLPSGHEGAHSWALTDPTADMSKCGEDGHG